MAGRGLPPLPRNRAQEINSRLTSKRRGNLEAKRVSSVNMVGQRQEGSAPSRSELGCVTCGESKGGKEEEHAGDKKHDSSDFPIEFLNALIEYRSEYLIYPFESQVATEDFINNWIKVPKQKFEELIDEFQKTLDVINVSDSYIDVLQPREKKVCKLVKKIWVTDNIGIDNIRARFLERLTNDVNDQITFLMKIIEYLPMTPTASLPVDDLPPIDNLIKNWLKVEVPISELEEVILALRRKYIGTGSEGENITDLKKEDQKAIQLVEKIWGPVFGTQNTKDEDEMKSSTDG